jgi:hypothetical protein
VSPMIGLEVCGNSRPTGFRSPDGTALRESPYRLNHPTHKITDQVFKFHIQGFGTDFSILICMSDGAITNYTCDILSIEGHILSGRNVRLFQGIWAVSGLITRVI